MKRAGDGAGERVGVDVVGLPVGALRDRRQDRDQLAAEDLLEHGRVDLVGLADKAEIDDVLAGRMRAVDLARADHGAVLAAEADRAAALGVDGAYDLLVDRSGEHHLDDLHRRLVGDAQAPGELRFDAELLQHQADLRAAAMHDDRIDAGLFEKHHVLGEVARFLLVPHRVAAVLHDDDRLVIAQHVRQRLHEDFGLLLGRGIEGLGHRDSRRTGSRLLLAARGMKLKRPGLLRRGPQIIGFDRTSPAADTPGWTGAGARRPLNRGRR